jgi:hypothetical protein
MYVKLDNKMGDKYELWVHTEALKTLMNPSTFENINDYDGKNPSEYKKNIIGWCHTPDPKYGVKFMLMGCFINSWDPISQRVFSLSIDHYERLKEKNISEYKVSGES